MEYFLMNPWPVSEILHLYVKTIGIPFKSPTTGLW